jgi:hypothetical protein
MAAEKLSISLDGQLAAAVRTAAAQEGLSISSWLAEAAISKTRQRNLGEALDAFAREHGPMSNAESDAIILQARRLSRVTTTPKLAVRKRVKKAA